MARIVSLGLATQNLYFSQPDQPFIFSSDSQTDLQVNFSQFLPTVSGGGVNSAITFARHHHETIIISNLANDSASSAILDLINQEDIDNSYLYFQPKTFTDTSLIFSTPIKSSTIFTYFGASTHFSNLDPKDLNLIQPDWLYASTLNGDMNTLRHFFETAKEKNIQTMFKPGPKEFQHSKKLIGLLEDIDILILNQSEARKIVPGHTLKELLYRLNNYVETVIITNGVMGGIASNRRTTYRFGIYEDVKVKDSFGAGDAFGSGFLAHYATNHSLRSALIFASANATSVITKLGSTQGILSKSASLHFMPIQKL